MTYAIDEATLRVLNTGPWKVLFIVTALLIFMVAVNPTDNRWRYTSVALVTICSFTRVFGFVLMVDPTPLVGTVLWATVGLSYTFLAAFSTWLLGANDDVRSG